MMRDMFSIPECNDEEACKWFIDRFDLEYTILTGGATFSTITAKNGEVSTLLTPHVEVADTVGAGDSFSGSFTGKLLSGAPLKEAHRAFRIISPKPASKPRFSFHHHQRGHVCHHGLVFHTHIQSAIGAITIVTIYAPQRRMMP